MKLNLSRFFFVIFSLFFNIGYANGAILFVPIEKSASIFIAHTLAEGLHRHLIDISDENCYPRYDIVEQKLQYLIEDKGIAREHLKATPANLDLLVKYHQKIVFHVRDLRQQVVSLANYHYSLKEHPQIIACYQQYNIQEWQVDDFIRVIIDNLPEMIDRIQNWLDVYKQGTIPMLITTYEEFHDNPTQFIEKILSFYDIPLSSFDSVDIPKTRYYNFRKGCKEEWREVLTLEQQNAIHQMIPSEFFTIFGWNY